MQKKGYSGEGRSGRRNTLIKSNEKEKQMQKESGRRRMRRESDAGGVRGGKRAEEGWRGGGEKLAW